MVFSAWRPFRLVIAGFARAQAPESAGCLILLHRRPYSAAAAAPAPAPAPAPALAGAAVLLPARPRAPAAPPRRRTRPAAAAPTAQPQSGGGGASRVPDMTNPASAARPGEASGIGWRLVRAVKGAAALQTGKKGRPRITAGYLAESQWEEQAFLSPNKTEALSPVLCIS